MAAKLAVGDWIERVYNRRAGSASPRTTATTCPRW
jgi:hypothetical protein